MNPVTSISLYEIVHLDDVQVSPDGVRATFVQLKADKGSNETIQSIWLRELHASHSQAQRLTSGRTDSSPRWTKDGHRLGFISKRDGESGVYVLPMSGGEAYKVASHPQGVASFEWSPDGARIAFVASARADERSREDEERIAGRPTSDESAEHATDKDTWQKQRDKEQRAHEDALHYDPRMVREFPYRSGTTYQNDRWSHIYVAEVPDSFADDIKIKPYRVTDGDANYGQPSWTRDAHALFGTVARRPGHTDIEYWDDLIRIDLAPGADKRSYDRMVSANYSHANPKISYDGQWVAVSRYLQDRPEYRNVTLALMPAAGGDLIDLTAALDRSLADFAWSRDSAYIYFTLIKEGGVNLFRVRIADRLIEQLTDVDHEITSFDIDANGRVIFAASTAADPSALFVRETDGRISALYQPNARFLAEYRVGKTEAIQYRSDDFTIQGWVITPPEFDSTKKYPLALEIHGGPSAMWGPGTRSTWHEWQTLANRGYVVFFCNPRGSGGYGEKFLASNCGDWGDGPMSDILRGVDLVAARGCVDTTRMAVTGGSYGGYLTAWLVGRDHRFKAAVAQRGVYNLISMRGVTDIPAFNDRETGVTPWEDIDRIWRLSPLSLAPNVQTPLLLEHSELDFRVPISQAEELYLALRSFKKTVELIRWPREGHELSRSGEPRHRVERIQRIVEWFDKYTAGDGK